MSDNYVHIAERIVADPLNACTETAMEEAIVSALKHAHNAGLEKAADVADKGIPLGNDGEYLDASVISDAIRKLISEV